MWDSKRLRTCSGWLPGLFWHFKWTLMLSFRRFISSKNAQAQCLWWKERQHACLVSGFREVNEHVWQTQLETHETVERFLFPVDLYSDGRLKHKYTRPPESRPDAPERLREQLPTLTRQITHRRFNNKPNTFWLCITNKWACNVLNWNHCLIWKAKTNKN